MNAVENQVRELVKVELSAANERFPQFHNGSRLRATGRRTSGGELLGSIGTWAKENPPRLGGGWWLNYCQSPK